LVEAPLNELPVFVKSGAFIPKQNLIQYTGQKTDEILYLHFYMGTENSSFNYYEDDGDTYNFEKEGFYKRRFEFDALNNIIFLKAKEGSYSTRNKTLKLILHGFGKTESPKIEGKNLDIKFVGNTIEVTTQLVDGLMQIKL
jgi:alpha-glucosidase